MRAHDVSGDVGDLGSVVVAARRSVASMGLGEGLFLKKKIETICGSFNSHKLSFDFKKFLYMTVFNPYKSHFKL